MYIYFWFGNRHKNKADSKQRDIYSFINKVIQY